MRKDLIYTITKEELTKEKLFDILDKHEEIKFVSIAAVDLIGHETDTKVPVKLFRKDIDLFLNGIAAQTDGSSVFLPKIATLNNAKVDMKADLDCNWFVEYNDSLLDPENGKPIGTIKIPCYLFHEGQPVDSRHILAEAEVDFKANVLECFKNSQKLQDEFKISYEDIKAVEITAATELEFWVKSPSTHGDVEALSTSQELKEQYWGKTRGAVRSAIEETLVLMDLYGLSPEMGHKEVGGVRAKLTDEGRFEGILEQLEIDWRFSNPKLTADYEMFVRNLVREVFIRYGLEVTFLAKPIDKIAGNGEHTHVGVSLSLKDGRRINIFNPLVEDYLSTVGYGSLMGILHNYEVINPFVTSSNEAFKRLKKGYEAPISIVSSLGTSPKIPSRNRTILIGLIRDENSPLATRFELRAPNPHTNTFLCLASLLMAMTDGINYAVTKSPEELLTELSKNPGEFYGYLKEDRAYRTEKDVFDDFSDEEREACFGVAPDTVFENIRAFSLYPEKLSILKRNGVFEDRILESFEEGLLYKWYTEINHRIIPNFVKEIRGMKKLHRDDEFPNDQINWENVRKLKIELMKDADEKKGLFNLMKETLEKCEYDLLSDLQKTMYAKMNNLRDAYKDYKDNLLDLN